MSIVNSNIDHFDQYDKVNVGRLKARGEFSDDMMINQFNSYKVVSDGEFLCYIKTIRDQ